jgi:antitoxin (DNA-binding transcriptional repressor) of toxin-antitoxin stability system
MDVPLDMAVLHISEADLARDVHAVLDRVQSGAEVIIERNAQPVAVLRAAEPRRRKLSEIAAALAAGSTAVVDLDFSKDVQEVINSHREPLDSSVWD